MGQVFLGESPGGRMVAVKVIHPALAADGQFRARFAREVDAARRVGGFHTAPVVDADPYADPPWMITAYIDGPSLQEAVDRGGPLPPERVRRLGAGLAEGLAAIHACGLVHRDLKPGNVIMAADGPRIIDFGIARAAGASSLTSAGVVVGTFGYMSPELLSGQAAGPACDVFALGCVLAFATTARPPFGDDLAAAVMFRVISGPPDLDGLADHDLHQLIVSCLAKDPGDRPAVDAVLTALAIRVPAPVAVGPPAPASASVGPEARTHAPLPSAAPTGPGQHARPAPRTTPPGRPRRRASRRRAGALIAAGTAIAALAATLPLLLSTGHPRAAPGHTPSAGPSASSRETVHSTSSPGSSHRATSSPGTSSPSPKPIPTSTIAPRNVAFLNVNATGVADVTFSPDGSLVAAGALDRGPTYVWDIVTGQRTALADPASYGVNAVAFSPDGKLLATADGNDNVYLWAMPSGKLLATLTDARAGGAPYAVTFSRDSRLVAVGEGDNQTDLWDVATRRLLSVLKDASPITAVAFSPDDKLLAAAGTAAFLWNVATGQRAANLYDPGGKNAGALAYSPDGTHLATADLDGRAYLWDVAPRTIAAALTPPGTLHSLTEVAFSPDGVLLAAGDENGNVRLWNAASGKLDGTFTDPSRGQVTGLTFSPDGRMLAVCDVNGNVYVRVRSELVS